MLKTRKVSKMRVQAPKKIQLEAFLSQGMSQVAGVGEQQEMDKGMAVDSPKCAQEEVKKVRSLSLKKCYRTSSM